jgi:hypothetical protein
MLLKLEHLPIRSPIRLKGWSSLALLILAGTALIALLGLVAQSQLKITSLRDQIARDTAEKDQIARDTAELAQLRQTIKDVFRERDELFISAYQREQVTLRPNDDYETLAGGNILSPNDTVDRTEVDCKGAIRHKNSAVILTLGQSNASNTVNARFDPSPSIVNFSVYDGKCYLAREPLIGPTNYGGNFATRLASKLVDRGVYQAVVLAPIAVGAAKVQDWAVGGTLNRRLVVEIKRLHDAGFQPTHVLWHQGEANINDPQDYTRAFSSVFATIRRNGVYAPVYVAQATRCGGAGSEPLRAVQRALVDPAKGILAGPNTDDIGLEYRYDGCHLDASGAEIHAEMWYQIIDAE